MPPSSQTSPNDPGLPPQVGLQTLSGRQRRLDRLYLFLAVLLIPLLGAPLIANDRPLLVRYDQQFYLPILHHYPEKTFGGTFETETNYHDPAVGQLIGSKGWMLWPLIPFGPDTVNLDLQEPFPSPPSAQNWLGTDDQGRDVLARVLYGLRLSLGVALLVTLLSSLMGIAVGVIQGYFGGWVDLLGQRLIEVWSGLPQLLIIMLLLGSLNAGVCGLIVAMVLFGWTAVVSWVRAEVLRLRQIEFVRAARALGVSEWRIMWRHILPNALQSTLSQLPLLITGNMLALTALDFLGYGLPPGTASLGGLLQQARQHLDAPWLVGAAFGSLALVMVGLVLLGDAIRRRWQKGQFEL